MRIKSVVLMGCMVVAGCASIPAKMAAKEWVGRSMNEAVSTFGEPRDVQVQGDGRKSSTWHLERYMDEVRPIGNVMGRDAGGRPVLHPVHELRQNRYACEVTLVSESGRIVSAKVRPIAGMGPLLAGGCAQRGL
jgi:hypothetical protein